jgi:hypothetical protein
VDELLGNELKRLSQRPRTLRFNINPVKLKAHRPLNDYTEVTKALIEDTLPEEQQTGRLDMRQ